MISLGGRAPHVLRDHMGVHRTRGEPNQPNEIELTPRWGWGETERLVGAYTANTQNQRASCIRL